MKLSESMVMPTPGNIVLRCSIILVLALSLKARSSVSMVVSHQISRPSIRSDWLKEEWKSLMKVLSVISCGLIQRKLRLGLCHQEVLVGYSDQKLPQNSITLTISSWLLEPINLWWTDSSTGSRIKLLLPFGQHPTIVTDAEMLHQSLILMRNSRDLSIFSMPLLRAQELCLTETLSHISSEEFPQSRGWGQQNLYWYVDPIISSYSQIKSNQTLIHS